MNFKLIQASVAAVALLALPLAAQAADAPIGAPYYKPYKPYDRPYYKPYYKAAPRAVVSYYNWTGLYAGLYAGYGAGSADWSAPAGTFIEPRGGLFGGTVGYNWQAGAIVYGIEGDFGWSGVKASVACGAAWASTCETSSDWLTTFRGRVGYAFNRWLPYVTGGGAYGDVRATLSPGVVSASTSQFGLTLGAGLEYAFLGSWTAKIEYLYVDLGHFDAGIAPATNAVSFTENILRAGLNYRFTGPILSRY